MAVFQVAENLFAIDLFEEGKPGRSSAYLIRGREPILVDTGSTRSHDALVQGLTELGLRTQDLRHVVVTHVHLDHAGGVGQMMVAAPEAILHCHPRAVRHVIDPTRLEAGARAVYGEHMEEIFGPLKPVAAERVMAQADETVLDTGDRELVFYDTPGHAKHHVCIVDKVTGGLFSGDTVGIRYSPQYTGWDFDYGFPTTSPSDFDPEVMLGTLDRLQGLNLLRVYHTHFGVTDPAEKALDFTRRGVCAIQDRLAEMSRAKELKDIVQVLRQVVLENVALSGHPDVNIAPLELDIMLNSQGILVYLQKKAAGKI